jgi:hypothetical protein
VTGREHTEQKLYIAHRLYAQYISKKKMKLSL